MAVLLVLCNTIAKFPAHPWLDRSPLLALTIWCNHGWEKRISGLMWKITTPPVWRDTEGQSVGVNRAATERPGGHAMFFVCCSSSFRVCAMRDSWKGHWMRVLAWTSRALLLQCPCTGLV